MASTKPHIKASDSRDALTNERVIASALQIVDRDGLEKLSMRKLGAELGVDPMAVYYYIPNKAALLDGLVEGIMTELGVPDPRLPGEDITEWFVRSFGEFMETLRKHPNVLTVMSTRPITGDAGMRAAECVLRELHAIGLPPDAAMAALMALTTITITMALTEVSRDPDVMDPAIKAKVDACYMNLSPEEFPLMLDGITRVPVKDWSRIHEFTIRTFVTGLLAMYSPENEKPMMQVNTPTTG